jgi:hypothetical protein
MRIRKGVRRIGILAWLGAVVAFAACTPSPSAETVLPLDKPATFTPLATVRPPGTSTVRPSDPTEPIMPTAPTATGAAADIVLPGWVP